MTTIVAVQGDGFAVITSDSRISSLDGDGFTFQITTLGAGTSKVAQNGKYLLGAAGDVRAINILQHAFQPPAAPASLKGKRLDAFITTKFIPLLRACFEEHGYAMPTKDGDHIAEQGSTIIAAVNGVIYIIEGDYSWTSDTNGIYAIGSGAAYALGAMQVLTGLNEPTIAQAKKNTAKALTVTSKFDPHTGAPFQTFVQEHVTGKDRPE